MNAKKILIVDDDADLVRLLSRRIGQAGFETLSAFDASMAMRLALKESPALILLDIRLPAGGGFGTLENLRHSGRTSAIPIIIITGQDDAATRERAERQGVEDFMVKPLNLDELLEKIKGLTGESKPADRDA
jgi:DNA-binding response OmpR family regulator